MASEFHKKVISNITPEQTALMVKSLGIISQIHAILEDRNISQKALADMLKISQPAVSKMLSPGGNLELNTVIKLELLLGETIITTPQDINEFSSSQTKKTNILDINTKQKEVKIIQLLPDHITKDDVNKVEKRVRHEGLFCFN